MKNNVIKRKSTKKKLAKRKEQHNISENSKISNLHKTEISIKNAILDENNLIPVKKKNKLLVNRIKQDNSKKQNVSSNEKNIINDNITLKEPLEFKNITIKTLYGKKIFIKENNKQEKRKRKLAYLKESLILMLIFSLLNIISYYAIDGVMVLNITSKENTNVLITFFLSCLLIFIFSFFSDWLISELMIKFSIKKRNGFKKIHQSKRKNTMSKKQKNKK